MGTGPGADSRSGKEGLASPAFMMRTRSLFRDQDRHDAAIESCHVRLTEVGKNGLGYEGKTRNLFRYRSLDNLAGKAARGYGFDFVSA